MLFVETPDSLTQHLVGMSNVFWLALKETVA